jgi:hypothetical protein
MSVFLPFNQLDMTLFTEELLLFLLVETIVVPIYDVWPLFFHTK